MENWRLKLVAILFISIALTCNAKVSLTGIWGISQNENAVFSIDADSIYYVDELSQCKYKTKGDSLFIQIDANTVLRCKYILGDDVLSIIHGKVSTKYIRMHSGRSPIIGICSIRSGFKYFTSRIENLITFATFNLTFSPNTTMNVGTSYLVANLGTSFCPDSDQMVDYNESARRWKIKIKSTGDVYFEIVSGSKLLAGEVAKFSTFKYSLF